MENIFVPACEHKTQISESYSRLHILCCTFIYFLLCSCVFSECNCNNKAEECFFNQTVADLSLSLDTHGQYRGGGVCIGCRDNTAGINCQSCITGYYRPSKVCRIYTDVYSSGIIPVKNGLFCRPGGCR